jgi:gliding motility-associated-like protein
VQNDSIFYPNMANFGQNNIYYIVGEGQCTEKDSSIIRVIEFPAVSAGSDEEVCGLNYSLNGQVSVGSVLWYSDSSAISFSNNATLNTQVFAQYQNIFPVILTANNENCINSDTIYLSFYDVPYVSLPNDTVINFTDTFTLYVDSVIGQGIWYVLSGNGIIESPENYVTLVYNLSPGTNSFSFEVSNGPCPYVSDDINIIVKEIFIPSAISPNGDGKNDIFVIYGIEKYKTSLQVFNRWGKLVYETNDYKNNWNGTDINGKRLPSDSYYYILNIDSLGIFNGYIIISN